MKGEIYTPMQETCSQYFKNESRKGRSQLAGNQHLRISGFEFSLSLGVEGLSRPPRSIGTAGPVHIF